MKGTVATLFTLAITALASPTRTVAKRATPSTQCGQYESIVAAPYTLFTNLWGESNGSGSQCSTLNSETGSTIAWSTNWSWSGG